MSLISYKNDYGWNCFTNIEGFEYSIDTLYVDVAEAGKLGQAILEKVENFTDVKALVVKGKLNSEDANRIRTSLTNLLYLDIAETTLEEIPYQMFSGKKNLLGIKLPKNLKVINSDAFEDCTGLTSVYFSSDVSVIGDKNMFEGCSSLKDIYFSGTEEEWQNLHISLNNELLSTAVIHYNSQA